MDSNGPKFAWISLKISEARLVPKHPQKHYLIDSLSWVSASQTPVLPGFRQQLDPNWTQVFSAQTCS
jgi:hypothetical protein